MFGFFIVLAVITLGLLAAYLYYRRRFKSALESHAERKERVKQANADMKGDRWATLVPEPDAPSKLTTRILGGLTIAFAVFTLGILWAGSTYTQDAGESIMQKDITGNIVGSTTETGLHFKPIWVDTSTFNIRNQQVIFVTPSKDGDNQGGTPDGPEITTNDKDGVQVNLDVAVTYSIEADRVVDIYKSYKSEDNFKSKYIFQAIRSAVREAPNTYKTIDVLTKRDKVNATIEQKLRAFFDHNDYGVKVDNVSLQQTGYDPKVIQAYNDAQQAQIAVTQEQAKLDQAKISAQQAVVKAEAQAKANTELNASLTPQILQQQYLDALKAIGDKGNLVVVPQGSTPFVQVTK